MNPDRRQLTPESTHGLVALSAVAICLAVAGLGVIFSLHHHHEPNHETRTRPVQKQRADNSPFGPELQILELFVHGSSPEQPPTTAKGKAPGPTNDDSGPASSVTPMAPSSSSTVESVWDNIFIRAFDASIAPNSALQVPATAAPISTLPVAEAPVATTPVVVAANETPRASTQPTSIRQEPPPPVALVQCGSTQCPEGEVCCNASCGTCTRPGDLCSQQVCGMSALPVSVLCGLNECNVGEVCCNPSCGTCARSEVECDPTQACNNPIEYPQSVACGMQTCNTGLVCCNPSCGICAPYGAPCSQDTCD